MADGFHSIAATPAPEDLARFPMNDFGNAMRLILLAGGEIDDDGEVDSSCASLLYLHGSGWVGFNGVFWDRKFGEDLARKLGHKVAQKLLGMFDQFAARSTVPAKEYYKWATDSGSAGKTSAMLRQAQSYLTVEIDAFDVDPMAINCLNGTLKIRLLKAKDDLPPAVEVKLRKHDPADRITRLADVDYKETATAPEFYRIVAEAMADPEERGCLQRTLGYASTGETKEQVFSLCQGRGRDGKSTILDACRETLGTYALAASPDTFLEGGMKSGSDAAPDLIALSGDTRLAVLSEPKRGAKLNEGLLKAWTSGSPISARDLHSKPINFRPRAKLVFECNSFPVARGDDDGIWRRVRPLLFRHQVPKEQVDKEIPVRLAKEKAGILNWLIAGIEDWLLRGDLAPPASFEKALEDYRRSSSPFGDWLRDRCITGEAAGTERVLVKDLFANFKTWFEDQGHEKPMSNKAFGDALRDRQITTMGKNAAGLLYRGPIRFKTEDELALDVAAAEADLGGANKDASRVGDQRGLGGLDDWGFEG